MNTKTNSLTRAALGIAAMFGIYWSWSCMLAPIIQWSPATEKLIGLICLYGIGLCLFLLIAKPVLHAADMPRSGLPFKGILFCILLQFSALMVFSLLNIVLSATGIVSAAPDMNSTTPSILFLLLVFNPVMEELVFRKLLGHILLPHGKGFFIPASAFCFAIVHGVALGLPQVVYTFLLGLIWAWVYARCGRFWVVVVLHSLSNLFGSVAVQGLMNLSEMAAGLYSMLLMALGALGLCLFVANRKKISVDGNGKLLRWDHCKEMATNPGILIYTALTVGMMVIKANT